MRELGGNPVAGGATWCGPAGIVGGLPGGALVPSRVFRVPDWVQGLGFFALGSDLRLRVPLTKEV